jgi:prevent-host-death family protein
VKISKSKLKSKLLEILREVESANTEVIVTDRGKPVAKISKFQNIPSTEELFEDLRGRVKYFEDLLVKSLNLQWSHRDLVDRIMVALALDKGCSIITKDLEIREFYERTIW